MAKKKKSKKEKSESKEIVTLVEDPYDLPDLELTSDEEAEEQFGSLEKAFKKEAKRNKKHNEEIIEESANADEELAAQIAEDQAIEAELSQASDEVDPEIAAALPQLNENGELDIAEVQSCIEALLLTSDKSLSLKKLKELIGPEFPQKVFKEAIEGIKERYSDVHHGFELVEVSGGYQFRTKPGRAPIVRQLAKVQPHKLSRGAMESLAIIAYRQPVMKEDIDKIRGVDSTYFIRGLLEKKLITISGRSELPGRPMLYSTTPHFLEVFCLNDLNSLPPLQEVEKMIPTSETPRPEDEDPKVKALRELVNKMNSSEERIEYDPKEDEKFLKEIREHVKSIPSSTPTLDAQKEDEKAQKKWEQYEKKAKEIGLPLFAEPLPWDDGTEKLNAQSEDQTEAALDAAENPEITLTPPKPEENTTFSPDPEV